MKHINNTALATQVIGRWDTADVAFVQSLRCTAQQSETIPNLFVEFLASRRDLAKNGWPDGSLPIYKIEIAFHNAQRLTLRDFGTRPTQIAGFDISDVSDRGLGDVNFYVEDYENGRISFECSGVEILSVEEYFFDVF